jgi:hypothetical protein
MILQANKSLSRKILQRLFEFIQRPIRIFPRLAPAVEIHVDHLLAVKLNLN